MRGSMFQVGGSKLGRSGTWHPELGTRNSPTKGSRMRNTFLALLIAGVLLARWASAIFGIGLEEQTQLLAAELRCPVCQNLSVGDSPSEMVN